MTQTLQLDRNITRFIGDETFPFKVTVCIGEKQIVCSGIALAEQSRVLESKIREDNGTLMFEEMIPIMDKPDNAEILLQCIRYLHGAPLNLSYDNLEVILKFASWYQVTDLVSSCLKWLRNADVLFLLDTPGAILKHIMLLFKLSNCLSSEENAALKDLAHKLVLAHSSEMFWIKMIDFIDAEMDGFDFVKMIDNYTGNGGGDIMRKWVALSVDNRNFVYNNPSLFDFRALFPGDEDDFSNFILLMSDDTSLPRHFLKVLLEIQKGYFKKYVCTVPYNEHDPDIAHNNSPAPFPSLSVTVSNSKKLGYLTQELPDSSVEETVSNDLINSQPSWRSFSSEQEARWSEQDGSTSCDDPIPMTVSQYRRNREKLPSYRVRISNLPPKVSKHGLRRTFDSFGKISNVEIIHADNLAVLTFERVAYANKLLNSGSVFIYDGFEQQTLQYLSKQVIEVVADDRYESHSARNESTPFPYNKHDPDIAHNNSPAPLPSLSVTVSNSENLGNLTQKLPDSSVEETVSSDLIHSQPSSSSEQAPYPSWWSDQESSTSWDEPFPIETLRQFKSKQVEVWNIPPSASRDGLRELFDCFEGLQDVDIITDITVDDYAILTFMDSTCAKTLLDSYRRFNLDGRKLELSELITDNRCDPHSCWTEPKPESSTRNDNSNRILYIGNIPSAAQQSELRQLFSGFGRLESFQIPNGKSYGFLVYENARSASALLNARNSRKYLGHELVIKRRDRKR